jgi:hypothetical protein
MRVEGWWLVAGGWWLVAGGWWLVAEGWWLMARAHRMTTAGASNAHPGMRSEWRPTACKTLSSAATLDLPTTRPVSSVMCTPFCDEEQQEAGGSAVRGGK